VGGLLGRIGRIVREHVSGRYLKMAKGKYTKAERSKAAKKGWRERKRRFWITRGVKVIDS